MVMRRRTGAAREETRDEEPLLLVSQEFSCTHASPEARNAVAGAGTAHPEEA